MKLIIGVAVALVLFTAIAHADTTLTNGAILDSLNVAHKKLDSGDKPGAKTELSALSAKLATSSSPVHKTWRRQVQWIVLKMTMGFNSSAETGLHELIKAVSSAGSPPPTQPDPPPAQPPAQPAPPHGA